MPNTILKILPNIASFSSFLPLFFFFIFQRNNKSKELRVILFYFIYCAVNEIITYYLFKVLGLRPFFIYDIFAVVEFCLFSWFFYLIIYSLKIKRLILPLIIIFCLFSLSLYILLPDSTSFSSSIAGVENVLIISMCIYYFFDQLKQSGTFAIYSTINFWIIISFLIYLAGTFFLYIYSESMINDKAFIKQYIIINSGFGILKNILLSIAMLMKPDKPHIPTTFPEDRLNADWNANQSLHNLN
jgi:hypothetical protein